MKPALRPRGAARAVARGVRRAADARARCSARRRNGWAPACSRALLLRLWPDIARSFTLPVRQLEGQSGRAGRERRARARPPRRQLRDLAHADLPGDRGPGAHGLVRPDHRALPAGEGERGPRPARARVRQQRGHAAASSASTMRSPTPRRCCVLEPFYVAAGFGLYLNRRTLLEGWDIEVALRRIAARHAAALVARCRHRRCADALSELCAGKRPEAGNRRGAEGEGVRLLPRREALAVARAADSQRASAGT